MDSLEFVSRASQATIGVYTCLYRYKKLKSGDYSKTTEFGRMLWVRCSEEEAWDLQVCGPLHDKVADLALSQARERWLKERGWYVGASESWSVDPRSYLLSKK